MSVDKMEATPTENLDVAFIYDNQLINAMLAYVWYYTVKIMQRWRTYSQTLAFIYLVGFISYIISSLLCYGVKKTPFIFKI